MKKCFKCGVEKPLSEFYKHKQMSDGHLNKCKECTKRDANNHRAENLDKVREYDKKRNALPHRVAARKEYAKSDAGRASKAKTIRKYIEKYPNKYKAHNMVNNAVRDGKLFKEPCDVCGCEKVHAHHDDYASRS